MRPDLATPAAPTTPATAVACGGRLARTATKLAASLRPGRLAIVAALLTVMAAQSGCVVPIWSPTPDRRVRQLIYTSEGLRHIPNIWERIWGLDMPDVATPYRTHGGVI